MRLSKLVIFLGMVSLPLAARADEIFDVNINWDLVGGSSSGFTPGSGGLIEGTITLDGTSFTALNLVATFPSAPFPQIDITGISDQGAANGLYYVDNIGNLQLVLPVSSLIGYAGGSICVSTSVPSCGDMTVFDPQVPGLDVSDFSVVSGTLTPVPPAVTPEPGSFVLLGTGVLGCVGLACQRRKRQPLLYP
jgi:hypothetical protein